MSHKGLANWKPINKFILVAKKIVNIQINGIPGPTAGVFIMICILFLPGRMILH